jgi:hypothetical protein
MCHHSPRACPLGEAPPVGDSQGTGKHGCSARRRRPRARICLRKGCRRKYQPRCWNQRYCQDPECLRQIRRWQAARRQAKHRQDAQVKARHTQVERERRQQAKSTSQTVENPQVTPARGHAAESFFALRYAIARVAMRIPQARRATPRATAALLAGRPSTTSKTVNASGCLATPSMAV